MRYTVVVVVCATDIVTSVVFFFLFVALAIYSPVAVWHAPICLVKVRKCTYTQVHGTCMQTQCRKIKHNFSHTVQFLYKFNATSGAEQQTKEHTHRRLVQREFISEIMWLVRHVLILMNAVHSPHKIALNSKYRKTVIIN